MDMERLVELLVDYRNGKVELERVTEELAHLPFTVTADAVVDTHRSLRMGYPEVVFGLGKTPEQVDRIAAVLHDGGNNVLVTKAGPEHLRILESRFGTGCVDSDPVARGLLVKHHEVADQGYGEIAVVSAGTSDQPVAAEAIFCARALGNRVRGILDVGVAGVHRLLSVLEDLRRAAVVVVVAGMEGALPSVVGGLVSGPIVAVPTSVGYGASFGGLAALLGMLNSCAPGVTVVNIDNGFGAAYAASLINRKDRCP